MIVTFPHLGNASIYAALLLDSLQIPYIIPPDNTEEGLSRGAALTPDDICLPFKLFTDNLVQAYKMGADTVIMPSSKGPCRLGEFCELLKLILDGQDCHYRWIVLDTPGEIGIRELANRFLEAFQGDNTQIDLVRALSRVYRVVKQHEALEARGRMMAGFVTDGSAIKSILNNCRKSLRKASSVREAMEILGRYRYALDVLPMVPEKRPTKVLLTGEIFTLIEPIAEMYLENLLFDLGVSFKKEITIGWWLRRTIINPFSSLAAEYRKCPSMPYSIGGYSKDTVAGSLDSEMRGFDGVIQMFPAGCMPEIVAKAVLDAQCPERGIPKLTLIFDEISGAGGYITRVEAFIDMLEQQIEKKGGAASVLSGN